MKKKTEFLGYISNYRQNFIWATTFIVFSFASARHATLPASIVITVITMTPMIVLTQMLKHILIPKFLHRHRIIYYCHSFLAILLLTILTVMFDIHFYRFIYLNGYMKVPEEIRENIQVGETNIGSIYLYAKYLILLSITFAMVTVSHMLDERKLIEQQTKEQQMQQELKYLRAQINPHFLFNALNCIYSLSLTQDEKAPDSVLKLSEMLRFVIDDCQADEVPISKEVAYIANFIDFQKIRMEKEPNIEFICNIENQTFGIPPMLFQPMVENCFKHSRIIDDPSAFIKISINQEGEHLTFVAENSKHKNVFKQTDDERTGIGVNNVRQRLELIFGTDYSFDITETENIYKTELKI